MRRITIGMLALGAVGLSSCGGGQTFANQARPPLPVNLTVYINDARVSVSPASVGAGPVVFIVTNMATHSESLAIQTTGSTQQVAETGPINPQGTAQVTVNFTAPGDYTIATGAGNATEAALATPKGIHPARLHIGASRPNGSSQLLQP